MPAGRFLSARRPAALAATVIAVLVLAGWELHFRGATGYDTALYPLDDADEWRYVACSRLVAHGYGLFSQVFSAQPPVLFVSLASAVRLGQDGIGGARLVEAMFGILGLVSAAWLAWELGGPWAGALAACLLAISPAYLVYAHSVEAEGPMMALMTLSLALAVSHTRTRNWLLAALAGMSLAAAVLTKLFAVEALLPLAWVFARPAAPPGRRVRGLLLCLACFGLPVLADFAFVSPHQQWTQVVRMHDAAALLHLPNAPSPFHVLRTFLTFDGGLTVLAAVGFTVLLLSRRWWETGLCATWSGGMLVMLAGFRPLFPHHPAILLTSFAAAGGAGLAAAPAAPSKARLGPLLVLAGAAVYLAFLPRLITADRHIVAASAVPRPDLEAFVRRHAGAADMVAVDDPRIADETGRLVVPPLCDPSNVRLRSGYLTSRDLITATMRYHPALVLFSFGIFQQVPAYTRWLQKHAAITPLERGATAYIPRVATRH